MNGVGTRERVVDFARDGFFGEGIGKIILEHGEEYRRDDESLSSHWRGLRGKKKMCYKNSAELALLHPELTYVEGYAFADIPLRFPLAHAWLIDEAGLVVDPTWESGFGYCGLSFPLKQLNEYLLLGKEYGILQSLWHKPRLREKFSADYGISLS